MTNCKIIQSNNQSSLLDYPIVLQNINRDIYFLKYLYPICQVFRRVADYEIYFSTFA